MKLNLLLTFLTTIISFNILAQSDEGTLEKTDAHNHDHHKNEIAIATSPAYFVKEKTLSYSLHMHYVYSIPKTKFGIGAAYERILADPKHHTFGLVTSYRPIEQLSLTLSPGITFEDNDPAPFFSLHTEMSYEFELGDFHIGPAFEFAYDPNDYHISLGLHVGYGF